MKNKISIKIQASILNSEGKNISEKDARLIAAQISQDASYGTFRSMPDGFWDVLSSEDKEAIQSLVSFSVEPSGCFWNIEIQISEELFVNEDIALQHFIGIVSGDLLYISIPGYEFKDLTVLEVDIESVLTKVSSKFRTNSNNIQQIKSAFNLADEDSLIAFSIKPRIGLSMENIKKLVYGVANAGFNIIEFDTRYVDLSDDTLNKLAKIAYEVAVIGNRNGRVSRLSLNFSGPSDVVLEKIENFVQLSGTKEPLVIKIDGNLDGMSTIQAVRRRFTGNKIKPIITCYPLMKSTLAKTIGTTTFVEMLSASGADIIYPGNCPTFEDHGVRKIDKSTVESGQLLYRKISSKGWPMLSVAGGVHAGELHCYYELLGPNVAFFIGGGVSLHLNGPFEGAKLCRKIMDEVVVRRKALSKKCKPQTIKSQMSVSRSYVPESTTELQDSSFEYIQPEVIFTEGHGFKTFFELEEE